MMANNLRIVIVEDNEVIKEGLKKYIESIVGEKISVFSFADSLKAMSFLQNNPTHLLITDIQLPLLSGIDLAKRYKFLYPEYKIIFISAYEEFNYAYEALQIGVEDYLIKPIDMEKLKNLIIRSFPKIEQTFEKQKDTISSTSLRIFKMHSIDFNATDCSTLVLDSIKSVESNYMNTVFNLDDLADLNFVTKGYLSNLFKKETQISMGRFLTSYRLEKAKALLEETNLKIKIIAKNSGFTDQSLFCKNFKKYHLVNPSEIRRGCSDK